MRVLLDFSSFFSILLSLHTGRIRPLFKYDFAKKCVFFKYPEILELYFNHHDHILFMMGIIYSVLRFLLDENARLHYNPLDINQEEDTDDGSKLKDVGSDDEGTIVRDI